MKIAILITSFKRPELLAMQLEFLTKTKYRIYISQDVDSEDQSRYSEEVIKCIELINENSQLVHKSLVYASPQGCYKGVSNAINWAFENEDALIIIEDDVLVSDEYINFAEAMLTEYRYDKKIGSICAMNLVPGNMIWNQSLTHRLSIFTSSWGWATWKDRWSLFLNDVETDEISRIVPKINHSFQVYWLRIFNETYSGLNDSWAYRWLYTNWMYGMYSIVPNRNLGLNLGFGESSTHTSDRELPWWLPLEIHRNYRWDMTTPLTVDHHADTWMMRNHFVISEFSNLKNYMRKRFPKCYLIYSKYKNRH